MRRACITQAKAPGGAHLSEELVTQTMAVTQCCVLLPYMLLPSVACCYPLLPSVACCYPLMLDLKFCYTCLLTFAHTLI